MKRLADTQHRGEGTGPRDGNPTGGDESAASGAMRACAETPVIAPPAGLEVDTFEVGPDQYALFSFPLPEWRLPACLTESECEVAMRLLRGEHVEEIARARGRSINTVRNQIRALYEKLGVGSVSELAIVCSGSGEPGGSNGGSTRGGTS